MARIEHVAARIYGEFHPLGRSKGRQLIEQNLRAEIRRSEIEQAVRHQHLQFWVERENFPQLGNRLGGTETAAAEIPGLLDLTIEQMLGAVRPPVQLARDEVDRGAGQRCGQGFAGRIEEMKKARN